MARVQKRGGKYVVIHLGEQDKEKIKRILRRGQLYISLLSLFFFQAEDGIRDRTVTGVQTCALPIWRNPLTARVMVNRVWCLFFGQPIVATPSNFGHSGQLPTHPDLLDHLAVRFMNDR